MRGLLLTFLLIVQVPYAQAQFDMSYGKYKDRGPNAMPLFPFEIPFNGSGMEEEISPIIQACVYLNNGFRKTHGWVERECTLVKYLSKPATLIEVPRGSRRFTHLYTPRKVGKEKLHFVMQFGDKPVEVICILKTTPWEH